MAGYPASHAERPPLVIPKKMYGRYRTYSTWLGPGSCRWPGQELLHAPLSLKETRPTNSSISTATFADALLALIPRAVEALFNQAIKYLEHRTM